MVESLNFEFLRKHRRELADLGGFAETYVFSDPSSSLVKLRQLAETVVQGIYSDLKLQRPYSANLNDLLNEDAFRRAVPHVVLNKIHSIRILGNKAAHGDHCSDRDALSALQQAFDLVRWLYVTFYKGKPADCANFKQPASISKIEQTEAQKKQLEAKLVAQEAEMQALLATLEAERSKVNDQAHDIGELQAVLEAGNKAAESLHFDEASTRKQLIDAMLIEVGWSVDPDGKSNESVAQELEVDKQPTTTGKGYVDYVLWGDDGKPLAVVEAKKTAVSPQRGQTQAKLYADSLEARYGQRPIIFYSNGFETFIWNDALSEPPRRIYGFYSKDSLQYLLFKRIERQPLETLAPDPRIAGRMYQIEAIKRVCERFSGNHRRSLIVQATGTGKTRVAISLCDTMVRAKWAKRILFLCDRKELRKQALNTFKEFLPGEPRTVVNSETHKDRNKSLLQRVFEAKITLAEVALDKGNLEAFDLGIKQMAEDIAALPETSVSIKEKWREIKSTQQGDTLKSFAAATRNALKNDVAPLMQWRDSRGNDEAYSFDLLVTSLQVEMLRGSASFADLKDKVIDAVSDLTININQVREKIDLINRVKSSEFWEAPTTASLENMRTELRGIMKYRRTQTGGGSLPAPIIDVKEDVSLIESNPYQPKLEGLQLVAYRKRVEEVLQQLFNTAPVLQKIRRAEAVSEKDIESLCSLVLTQHPDVDLHKLAKFYPEMSGKG